MICKYFLTYSRLVFYFWRCPLLESSFLVWSSSTDLFLLFLPLLLKSESQIQSQDQCQGSYSLCSILGLFWNQILCSSIYPILIFIYSFIFTLSYFLCMVIHKTGSSFILSMWLSDFLNTIYWRYSSYTVSYSWLPSWLLTDYIHACLFLSALFCSIHLCVYFYANTILFWLL